MLDFSTARITKLASTWVGNSSRHEGFKVPEKPVVPLTEIAEELLLGSFLKPFEKASEFFCFYGDDAPVDNTTFVLAESIFSNPDTLALNAGKLTTALYEASENPKIQGGEFFVMYFEDLMADGQPCSGIGLWKVEGHTPFFKTERTPEMNLLGTADGIAYAKPQVAALILNLDEPEGYQVCVIDTVTKKGERSFWKDDFLRIRPVADNYFQTLHLMSLTAEFVSQRAPFKFELNQGEVLGLLIKAGDYFKDSDTVEVEDFATYLFPDEDQASAFLKYRQEYETAYAVPLEKSFDLNPAAVKKMAKLFKAGLKLDRNFTLAVKSRADLIEMGYDEESGKKFLKLFYEFAE